MTRHASQLDKQPKSGMLPCVLNAAFKTLADGSRRQLSAGLHPDIALASGASSGRPDQTPLSLMISGLFKAIQAYSTLNNPAKISKSAIRSAF